MARTNGKRTLAVDVGGSKIKASVLDADGDGHYRILTSPAVVARAVAFIAGLRNDRLRTADCGAVAES